MILKRDQGNLTLLPLFSKGSEKGYQIFLACCPSEDILIPSWGRADEINCGNDALLTCDLAKQQVSSLGGTRGALFVLT